MVGSPFQTPEMLVKDLKFIEKLSPEMCGIGPFVPHKDTKFKMKSWRCKPCAYVAFNNKTFKTEHSFAGNNRLRYGRSAWSGKGHSSRCKCCNAQSSPVKHRKDYSLYDNKICTGDEAAQCIGCLADRMKKSVVKS